MNRFIEAHQYEIGMLLLIFGSPIIFAALSGPMDASLVYVQVALFLTACAITGTVIRIVGGSA